MLDRMERSGLVSRKPSPTDRRAQLICLTDKARSLQQEYDRLSDEMNALYYRGFEPEEIRQLENYLQRILDNLEGREEP